MSHSPFYICFIQIPAWDPSNSLGLQQWAVISVHLNLCPTKTQFHKKCLWEMWIHNTRTKTILIIFYYLPLPKAFVGWRPELFSFIWIISPGPTFLPLSLSIYPSHFHLLSVSCPLGTRTWKWVSKFSLPKRLKSLSCEWLNNLIKNAIGLFLKVQLDLTVESSRSNSAFGTAWNVL